MRMLTAVATLLLGAAQEPPPNLIFILADDLGYGHLGSYGQSKIKTPHLDRLASEGLRFTQMYSGNAVCAPSRCALMTGRHMGRAAIRSNREIKPEGQEPMPADTRTVGHALRERGYATACIGKWGLGAPGSASDPGRMGFDHFFGYNCQRQAHTFYPPHLWRNDRKVELDGKTYSHDLLEKESLDWVRANKAKPFFLYLAYTIPHVALQVPDDSLAEYKGRWEETPYTGGKGYVPHATPRAALAAMITRMDRSVGRLTDLLRDLGLDKNTIVIFTSDNGAVEGAGGSDLKFFEGNGPLRDGKGSLYEGGIRVPFIAWGKGVPAGKTSDVQGAFYDMPATLCSLAGAKAPPGHGRDLSSALLGQDLPPPDFLYWEFPSYGGQQAVRVGDWKGIRTGLLKGPSPIQLYDLKNDLGETTDVAAKHPDVVARIEAILKREHQPSELWRMKGLEGVTR